MLCLSLTVAQDHDFTNIGYKLAALTSFFATGLTLLIWVIIIRISFKSYPYKEVMQAFGVSECHDWFVLVDFLKLNAWLDDGTFFVDKPGLDMATQIGVLCWPLKSLNCMTAKHLCSVAWLCQWQELCPASDNHRWTDLSVIWFAHQTC